MTGYKLFYNEETKLVDCKEFFCSREFDHSNDPGTNFEEEVNAWTVSRECAESKICEYNADIKSGKLEIRKCRVCGMYFPLYQSEAKWFKDKGLSVPKRCHSCRRWHRYAAYH